jgi:hypothetical protein
MLKSTAYSLLVLSSFALHSMEKEIIQFSELLDTKLQDIQLYSTGQKINVTEEDNKKLLKWIIMGNSSMKDEHRYFLPNRSKKASITPGIYLLKNDSTLNKKYKWYSFMLGNSENSDTLHLGTAHHLGLVQSIPKLSIFNSYSQEKITGYDLAIIYQHPDEPTRTTDHFELKKNENDIDNGGFDQHINRINNVLTRYTKLIDIIYLISLNRN